MNVPGPAHPVSFIFTGIPRRLPPTASRTALLTQNDELHVVAAACIEQVQRDHALLKLKDRENRTLREQLHSRALQAGKGKKRTKGRRRRAGKTGHPRHMTGEENLNQLARQDAEGKMQDLFKEARVEFKERRQAITQEEREVALQRKKKEAAEKSAKKKETAAAKKAAKEQERAAARAMKEQERAAARAAKEQERMAKAQEREAAHAVKAQEREAARAVKEQERAAKAQEREAAAVAAREAKELAAQKRHVLAAGTPKKTTKVAKKAQSVRGLKKKEEAIAAGAKKVLKASSLIKDSRRGHNGGGSVSSSESESVSEPGSPIPAPTHPPPHGVRPRPLRRPGATTGEAVAAPPTGTTAASAVASSTAVAGPSSSTSSQHRAEMEPVAAVTGEADENAMQVDSATVEQTAASVNPAELAVAAVSRPLRRSARRKGQ
ncbi:uncharacterized protein B0H18DRAFT_960572 [Fomitopsis serialis]|uniref:uncharacterized protein n=1 Tax=Fomitopsis serialis TaxID=139415 RepID=UPI0020085700|nr:uncharacterized protein B0H18DRAFT_960572 [Neoantrodia serialis]KAH9913168.1 hypothetical protein B0H18DRAFT_960572 [Neoantrodia serialis]